MITFKYLMEQVKLYKKKVLLANLIAIFTIVISVPIPLFIPFLVDEVLLGKEGKFLPFINMFVEVNSPVYYILIVFILTLSIRAINIYFVIMRRILISKVVENIRLNIRKKMLSHLRSVSMSEYDVLGSGAISSKMTTDIRAVMKFLSDSIGTIAVQMFTLIGISVVLLYLNWQLALVILILNPLVMKFFISSFKRVSELLKKQNKAISSFTNSLTESLELFNQIRVQNREGHFSDTVHKDASDIRDSSYEYQVIAGKTMSKSRMFIMYSNDLFKMLGLQNK